MALRFDMSKDNWRDAYMAGQQSAGSSPTDAAYQAGENIGAMIAQAGTRYQQHSTEMGKKYQRYLLEDHGGKAPMGYYAFAAHTKGTEKRDKAWREIKKDYSDEIYNRYKLSGHYQANYPGGGEPSDKDVRNWAFSGSGRGYMQALEEEKIASERVRKQKDRYDTRAEIARGEGKGLYGLLGGFLEKGDPKTETKFNERLFNILRSDLGGKFPDKESFLKKGAIPFLKQSKEFLEVINQNPDVKRAYESYIANPDQFLENWEATSTGKEGFLQGLENYLRQHGSKGQTISWLGGISPYWRTETTRDTYKITPGKGLTGIGRGLLDAVGLGPNDPLTRILMPGGKGFLGLGNVKRDWQGNLLTTAEVDSGLPASADKVLPEDITIKDIPATTDKLTKKQYIDKFYDPSKKYLPHTKGRGLWGLLAPKLSAAKRNEAYLKALKEYGIGVEQYGGLAAGGGIPGPLENIIYNMTGQYPGHRLFPKKDAAGLRTEYQQ